MRDLKIKKIKLFVLILLLLSSCAGEKVKVTTFPDKATVSIQEKNGQIVDLGVTPIELNSSDVFQSQNMAQVILSKEGYLSERLYLSRSDIPTGSFRITET